MKKTDEFSNSQNQVSEVKITYDLDTIDLDYEISKLSKTNRRAKFKSETLNITIVSLLLSMSTAVSLINLIIPMFITTINIGFVLKYFIIAISFQVVGLYWGMIIGLLDGLLQFIIWGMSPLFRLTSAVGLVVWVFLFWLLFEKLFSIYTNKSTTSRTIASFCAGIIILFIQPFVGATLTYFRLMVEVGVKDYSLFVFVNTWISLMVFDLFAIILFVATTYRIQLIISKYRQ